MATKKFTLNELRIIVKKLIKEGRMLNEDNLQVKSIAKQLYSFLKKNGVREVSLDTRKLNIGKDSANDAQGNQIGNRDNTAKIAYFDDPKTKQTIIEVYLFGDYNKIQEIEKMLLNSFPGLGQLNRELDKNSNSPKDKVYYLFFTVAEKTTAKGGLVGNTKQNAPQQQAAPVNEGVKKITLNELRSIVKQIIKEETAVPNQDNQKVDATQTANQIKIALEKKGLKVLSEKGMAQIKH